MDLQDYSSAELASELSSRLNDSDKKGYGCGCDVPDKRDLYFDPSSVGVASPVTGLIDLRKQFPFPKFDQGQLGCHDERTEVLTVKGFVPWSCYNGKDLLGTMNPTTHKLEFQAPKAIHTYQHDGWMYNVDKSNLSFSVTPNHRMYVRRWNQEEKTLESAFQFKQAQQLGWYCGLPATTSGWLGTDLKRVKIGNREYAGDDFIRLVSIVTSCGWVGSTENTGNRISFCNFRHNRYEEVRDLAWRIGFAEVPGRRGVYLKTDAVLVNWFKQHGFVGNEYYSPFKQVPQIVKEASEDQIKLFLGFFGDKHEGQFYSSSKKLIDDLQELNLKVGNRSGIYSRDCRRTEMADGRIIEAKGKEHILTVWNRNKLSLNKKADISCERYKGTVYCATVDNSLLITRRKDKLLISGNSCTANGTLRAVTFDQAKQGLSTYVPSRLYQYYNSRLLEHTTRSDSGATIRDAIKAYNINGACPESDWPYLINKFKTKPPVKSYKDGATHRPVTYQRVWGDTISSKKVAMDSVLTLGYPIVIGFSVYESFESDSVASNGIVPMPAPGEQQIGGHCVVISGKDDNVDSKVNVCGVGYPVYICDNSWGEGWGDHGSFYIPQDYLLDSDLAEDFWMIQTIK